MFKQVVIEKLGPSRVCSGSLSASPPWKANVNKPVTDGEIWATARSGRVAGMPDGDERLFEGGGPVAAARLVKFRLWLPRLPETPRDSTRPSVGKWPPLLNIAPTETNSPEHQLPIQCSPDLTKSSEIFDTKTQMNLLHPSIALARGYFGIVIGLFFFIGYNHCISVPGTDKSISYIGPQSSHCCRCKKCYKKRCIW